MVACDRHVGVDVPTTREHTVTMRDPGYDATEMTVEEFDTRMEKATPEPSLVVVMGPPAPFTTGSNGATRTETVRLAGDQTIREYRVLAGT